MELTEYYIEKNVVHAKIVFNSEEVNNAFNLAYNELSSTINVPGFRKGHVPYNIFKNFVNKNKFEERILSKMIEDGVKLFLEEKKELDLIDLPKISKTEEELIEGKPYSIELIASIYPKVILPDVNGKELEVKFRKDKESILKDKIDSLLEANATFTEKEDIPSMGDWAVVEHYIEGASGEKGEINTSFVELGKEQIFPDTDKELINMKRGEEKVIERELSDGSKVLIHVKLLGFKQKVLPTFSEEFLKSINYEGDINKFIEEKSKEALEEEDKEKRAVQINTMFNYLIENSKIEDIPDDLLNSYIDDEVYFFEDEIKKSNLTLEEFLVRTNQTIDSLRENFKPKALLRSKIDLILKEVISKNPQCIPDDKEVETKVSEIMGKYKDREMNEKDIKNYVKNSIARERAIDYLNSNFIFKYIKEES